MTRPGCDPAALAALARLAERALARRSGLVVFGLSGAQGSGKTTLVAELGRTMNAAGIATVTLSLDDFYHTRAERMRLAAEVHPLLITRGVPGTHDIALALATLDALARGAPARLPRFDKARDDRVPVDQGAHAPPAPRLVLFEGWCLGARPQADAALAHPANALEASEDADGRWRRWVNAALARDYQALWARIDALAMLRAPDFATVLQWREAQEAALRAAAGEAPGVMDNAAVERFVAHYERITRHLLADLPARADVAIDLDHDRRVAGISYCGAASPGSA